jgi:hypothetical protein
MGLVFKSGQWELVAGGTSGFDPTAGATGGVVARISESSVLTGSLLQPSGAVSQANIFSARGAGGTTGKTSSRISVNSRVSANLDLRDFSSGFTWAGWIKPDSGATNSSSTIFFCSDPDGSDAIIFRRNGTTSNLIFEYYNGTTLKAKATTDSTPWSNNVWRHYALSFSDTNRLRIYRDGNAIQFDVNTDTGGSTQSNVTAHTFNTSIPVESNRREFRMFGGDLKTNGNDGLTGEYFNIGFWNEELEEPELAVLYSNSGIDFSQNLGDYGSAANLVFSCSFNQTAADGTNIAFQDRGITSRFLVSGSTKPS